MCVNVCVRVCVCMCVCACVQTNASTIRAIEPLLEEGERDRGRGKPDLKNLKAFHFQAIERVYGDHGPEIVDHIKRAPLVAINVVLPRLRQKDEEWRKARRDMNKIWRDVYKVCLTVCVCVCMCV